MNGARYSKGFWRGFLLGATALLLGTLLWQGITQPPPAYGQVPDSGAQRQRMIKEMVGSNQKLTEIVELLKQIRDQTAGDSGPRQRGNADTRRP